MATIAENLQTIKDSTDAIKQAIIDKGGNITGDITTWADAINGISGGGSVATNHGFTGEIINTKSVGIRNYTTIVVDDGITALGDYAFSDFQEVTSVYIPDTVTVINTNAFYNCKKLSSIRLPNNIKQIMANVFYGCNELASIKIPDSVFLLGTQAFRNCTSLEEVVAPVSVTTIRGSIFYGCTNLKRVIFEGDIITSVGATTFRDCTSLEVVDLSNCSTVIKLDNVSAFQNVPTTCKIVVPDSLYDNWKAATNWSSFASQIIKKSDYESL